ncbi:MAG TPA: family 16 glycosylhydrolase [Azospirillum sp.]|nr:family 16 glycosylhydrolase [Azospirillum sp.]
MRTRTAAFLMASTVGLAVLGGSAVKAASLMGRTGGSFEERFSGFDASRWQRSDGWSNGAYMGCAWSARNTIVANGRLSLSITDQPVTRERYACAEYRTHRHYGYGTYSVNLKAVRADGVMTTVSSFTGRPFGDPWDEVTLGIAGKDTTRLEVGYVANGVGHRDVVVDLGFDAAKGFHTYGFERRPDGITWLVDGRPVHTVKAAPADLPQAPGRLYLQLWNGVGNGPWLKEFRYPGTPLVAEVAWVRYEESAATLNN